MPIASKSLSKAVSHSHSQSDSQSVADYTCAPSSFAAQNLIPTPPPPPNMDLDLILLNPRQRQRKRYPPPAQHRYQDARLVRITLFIALVAVPTVVFGWGCFGV
ncbi:hypothetical protein GYMLUDRAFT_73665 [Collybiopsis luxurians FD-317 M1]|uniref:Uncharacterized protein n=1 Tax=Collybiopsis luxurians FD-317 M1 TaxID=944289 RepID=A0A0D0CE71_9AGAR|nr:hypothetical protein GYMLUDRAFT_73665 [Collybiopsis luxurians FD-317 M1]